MTVVTCLGRRSRDITVVREFRCCGFTRDDRSRIVGFAYLVVFVAALFYGIADSGGQSLGCFAFAVLQREGGNAILEGHIAVFTVDIGVAVFGKIYRGFPMFS